MSSPKNTHKLDSLKPLHAPKAEKQHKSLAIKVYIPVHPMDHSAPAILHVQKTMQHSDVAVILISGAGGGVSGPGGIYVSLADKLARECSVPTLRLDYREPATNEYCTPDVLAALDYLKDHFSCRKFVVCGWSFGGAPAFTAAARDERIVGVATVASQTADTAGISKLAPRPLLLLHGTGDTVLSDRCSKNLYEAYGAEKGERNLKLFDGDDHGLTTNALEAESMIFDFACRVLGKQTKDQQKEDDANSANLLGSKEDRVELMKEGRDLENEQL